MQQARERAKSCMAEAQQEADIIRANAFQEGYSKGVLQAAGDLSVLLLQSRVLASTLQADLLQAARALLGDLLKDEQLLDTLLQRWQGEWAVQGQVPLQIILPLRCRPEQAALKNTLKGLGVEIVDIRFHAQERYLFRVADQVVELDIGAAQERLSPRLIAQLKQLPKSVRQLDEGSRDFFVNWAASLGDSPNHFPESDNRDEH
ncbi:hypothetical protein BK658_19695 [Pseudomonas brassicacearum]|uniref:Oxygen-regulated invasion protein OrgB n=2 Tax=Pseudomonas brassicacearum TaxID=930166 RepID=A0A423GNJ7_9PSED|nr:hypothetical protein BK658_19695 [Pseudomonas brassicacearum]